MINTNAKQDTLYIDLLSIVAAFSVICLHASLPVMCSKEISDYWIVGHFIAFLNIYAVPVFFMISGATLMDYRRRYGTMEYFKRRTFRIVVPFLAWSLLAAIPFYLIYHPDQQVSVRSVINYVLGVNYMTVYWFFWSLFAIYLSIPVLSLLPRRVKLFSYLIAYACLSYSVAPLLRQFLGINIPSRVLSPISAGFIMYPLLGWLLASVEIPKRIRILIYSLGVIGYLVPTCLCTTQFHDFFYRFEGLTTSFYACSIFVFFRYTDWSWILQRERLHKFVLALRNTTFGIYLIHMFLSDLFVHYFGIDGGYSGFLMMLYAPLPWFACCALLIHFMRKSRIFRRILP